MNIRHIGTAVLLSIFLCPAAGSAFDDGGSTVAKHFGQSFHAVTEAQIADPDAGIVTGPVEGFEGKAAENTMNAYYESFTQEQARQAYSFDLLDAMVGGDD